MDDAKVREQLAFSLAGKGAHMTFDNAVKGFPVEKVGVIHRLLDEFERLE